MKKYLIAAFTVLCFAFSTKAQTGLTFNQVLMPNGTMGSSTGNTFSIGTVPAGKVWKLENFTTDYTGCMYLRINGVAANLNMPSSSSASSYMAGPMWFPAGTQLSMYRSCNTTPNTSTFFFSIIEFTVTP